MGRGRNKKGRGKGKKPTLIILNKETKKEEDGKKTVETKKDTEEIPCQEELICCLSCKKTEGYNRTVSHGKGKGESSRRIEPCRYAAAKVQFYLSGHCGSWEEMLDLHIVKSTTNDRIVTVLSEFDADRFIRKCGHAGLLDGKDGTVHCFSDSSDKRLEECLEESTECEKFYPQNNITNVTEGYVI